MFYTKLLTWSLNLVRYFIERMMISQWLLKVPPCLRSRDRDLRETLLTETRLDEGTESAEL